MLPNNIGYSLERGYEKIRPVTLQLVHLVGHFHIQSQISAHLYGTQVLHYVDKMKKKVSNCSNNKSHNFL
jgi:hypothetical protein